MHISFRLLKPLLSPLRTNRQRIPLSILYIYTTRETTTQTREEREQKSHRRLRRQGDFFLTSFSSSDEFSFASSKMGFAKTKNPKRNKKEGECLGFVEVFPFFSPFFLKLFRFFDFFGPLLNTY